MSAVLPNTKKKLKAFRKRKNEESKIDQGLIKEQAIIKAFSNMAYNFKT